MTEKRIRLNHVIVTSIEHVNASVKWTQGLHTLLNNSIKDYYPELKDKHFRIDYEKMEITYEDDE